MDNEFKKNDNVVIVTGAAGFIGFSLTLHLLNQGTTVVGIDNLCGKEDQKALQIKRLKLLQEYGSFVFLQHDLSTDCASLAPWFKSAHTIVHLAASAGVRESMLQPKRYIQNNIVAFSNTIHLASRCNIKHFVFASSSSVYGNSCVPFDGVRESMLVDTPKSIYAMTKKENELEAYVLSTSTEMRITGLRFFSVYGQWGRPDMAPWLFAKAMIFKTPITLYGDGSSLRDFTHIDDVVKAVTKIIYHKRSSNYEIYNVGCSSPRSITELITLIKKETNNEPCIIKGTYPLADVDITYANMDKFFNDYGKMKFQNIEIGIPKFCKWIKTIL